MRIWWLALLLSASGELIEGGSSLRRWKTRGAHSLEALLPEDSKDAASSAGPGASSLVQQMPREETTHESWFSRLGNSFAQALFGLILIPFALALMWLNELRNARQETILQMGDAEVHSVSSKSPMDDNLHGQLVLLNDSSACGEDVMTDARFPMVSGKGLRLRSTVEVYQWDEKKTTDKRGGGETTTTMYSYTKKWSKFQIDSRHFKDQTHRNNICIPGLQAGEQSLNNRTVRYGESSYYLPSELVSQLSKWTSASELVKAPLTFDSYTFEKESSSEWFYYPMRSSPEVGDVRVCFEYVADGPVSIMALQCADKIRAHGEAASFLPYRLVNRGICGSLSGEDLKEALLAQGRKHPQQLYEEDACRTGPFFHLCCCCNLITLIFARASPPQIFAAWHGHLPREQCFSELELMGNLLKWGLRILSWILLYAAVYMLFEPLIVILDVIPFLGKYISSGTSWVLGVVILFITAILATGVISLAYLVYHPLMALICLAGVGLILGTILGISRVL